MTNAQEITNRAQDLLVKILQCEEQLREVEQDKKVYRKELEDIVLSYGDMEFPNVGSAKLTAPSTTVSFDVQKVQKVIDALINQKQYDLAESLTSAKTESYKKASLRITKVKG